MKNGPLSLLSLDNTSTSTPLSINNPHSLFRSSSDTITRTIVDNATKAKLTVTWPTSEVNEQIDWYLRYKSTSDVEVLKKYAKWQRKYIDYQATYAALLLGAISEEDFEKDAEQYAPDIKDLPLESIIPEIAQLESLLDFDLRTQELADYFEAEPNTINQALEQVYTYLQLKDKKIKSTEALTGKNE